MRFAPVALVAIFAAVALPAAADELAMDAPTLAETEDAKPDWYRQFTISNPSGGLQAWETEPTRDVNFAWVKGERWQVNIDLTSRPDTSPLPREQVSAGATFRLTPRISIGGAVSIGSDELDNNSVWEDEDVETGIRLQSAFKF